MVCFITTATSLFWLWYASINKYLTSSTRFFNLYTSTIHHIRGSERMYRELCIIANPVVARSSAMWQSRSLSACYEMASLRSQWQCGYYAKLSDPHPQSDDSWFRKALRQRAKIEPVISHLKSDHWISRCRYKKAFGDTGNGVLATLAWNSKKIVRLLWLKEEKRAVRKMKQAA